MNKFAKLKELAKEIHEHEADWVFFYPSQCDSGSTIPSDDYRINIAQRRITINSEFFDLSLARKIILDYSVIKQSLSISKKVELYVGILGAESEK